MQEHEELATDEPPEEELDDVLDDDDDAEMTIATFEIDSLEPGNGLPELSEDDDDLLAGAPDDDVDDDLFDDDVLIDDSALIVGGLADVGFAGVGVGVGTGEVSPIEARVAELEAAARTLAEAEVTREGQRVKRKVTAATTGAGAVGLLPVLLELVDAISLTPSLAATASAGAAIVGAFAAGWYTPERSPALPPSSAHTVLKLGEDV
jgi:hypothetical protein